MTPLIITADWDEEAGVWVATSDDILGLVTEADTLEALRHKLADLVPALIEENGLPHGADPSAPIEIVSRQRLAIRAA
jgi:predicted RNase H-like HicB family nuclease